MHMYNKINTCRKIQCLISTIFLTVFFCCCQNNSENNGYLNKKIKKDFPFELGSNQDYFKYISAVTSTLGLKNLTGGYDSFQLRIWITNSFPFRSEGNLIILNRNERGWHGANYKFESSLNKQGNLVTKQVKRKELKPKSWNVLISELVNNDILILRDKDSFNPSQYAPTHDDANIIIIEFADTSRYRLYSLYLPNETFVQMPFVKKLENIVKTLISQFGMNDLKNILPEFNQSL